MAAVFIQLIIGRLLLGIGSKAFITWFSVVVVPLFWAAFLLYVIVFLAMYSLRVCNEEGPIQAKT